jgi:Domain of unknown function (DUF1906)
MNRTVVDCPFAAIGFDCDTRLTAAQYLEMRALGFRFAIRYLGDLASAEVDDALNAGLLVGAVQHAHAADWVVGSLGHTGAEDGARAARDALYAELPTSLPLYCDLEEPSPTTSVASVHAYSAGWCAAVVAAGFEARVYWGAGMPGSPVELYQLAFTGYWRSFSNVITPWGRGYQMMQLFQYPRGELLVRDAFPSCSPLVAGVAIDVDVAGSDYKGGRPRFVAGV